MGLALACVLSRRLRVRVHENQCPNRDCQRGALRCEMVSCDPMTSGFVSDLFTSSRDKVLATWPLSRRLDRCDRVIQNESRDPFGGNVHYVTMQITFLTSKFRNGERNLHCDVVHMTTKWVSSLILDCNGVFAIKAYRAQYGIDLPGSLHIKSLLFWDGTPFWDFFAA